MSSPLVEAQFDLPALSGLTASPGGEHVAYRRASADQTTWLVRHVETGRQTVLEDTGDQTAVAWHPQQPTLFYTTPSDQQGRALRIWDGESSHRVTTLPADGQLWDTGPQGAIVYYITADGIGCYDRESETHRTCIRTTTLWRPELAAGVAPTGARLVYATKQNGSVRLHTAAPDGSEQDQLDVNGAESEIIGVDWAPDGDRLLLRELDATPTSRVGTYDVATDTLEWINIAEPVVSLAFATIEDDQHVIVRRGGRVVERPLGRCTPEGDLHELPVEGTVTLDATSPASIRMGETELAVTRDTWTAPCDLLLVDVEPPETTRVVATEVGELDPTTLVAPERIDIPQATESDISGYLFDSGERPSPVLVKPYSARPAWGNYYRPYLQYLLALGYSVVLPEYFYPDEPLFDDREHDAYAAVGRWVREQRWADEDRIGLIGHSHGGYNVVMQALLYPDLWDAAVAAAPVVDLFEHHRQKDTESYIEAEIGAPTDNRDTWRAQSPITHAASLGAPLLVLHGSEDENVTPTEIDAFRRALTAAGIEEGADFEFERLLGQGHSHLTVDEQIEKWTCIADFLDRHL